MINQFCLEFRIFKFDFRLLITMKLKSLVIILFVLCFSSELIAQISGPVLILENSRNEKQTVIKRFDGIKVKTNLGQVLEGYFIELDAGNLILADQIENDKQDITVVPLVSIVKIKRRNTEAKFNLGQELVVSGIITIAGGLGIILISVKAQESSNKDIWGTTMYIGQGGVILGLGMILVGHKISYKTFNLKRYKIVEK